MAIRLQVGEILDSISAAPTKEEKIAKLLENDCVPVREIFRTALGIAPLVAVSRNEPAYRPSSVPYPFNDFRLMAAVRMFDNAFRHTDIPTGHVSIQRRWLSLLESLNAGEAKYLVDAHLGRLDLGLSNAEIAEAFGWEIESPVTEAPVEVKEETKVEVVEAPPVPFVKPKRKSPTKKPKPEPVVETPAEEVPAEEPAVEVPAEEVPEEEKKPDEA